MDGSGRYPYGRSDNAGAKLATATSQNVSGPHQGIRPHQRQPGHNSLHRMVNEFMQHIKGLQTARQIWEVAVRRNAMTTSLALLGGVLLADTCLFPHGTKHFAHKGLLQTSLAAKSCASVSSSNGSSSSSSNSGAGNGSSGSSSSSSGSSASGTGCAAVGGMQAHA